MSVDLAQLVTTLESKLHQFTEQYKLIQQENKALKLELKLQDRKYQEVLRKLQETEKDIIVLRNKNKLLDSQHYKHETRAKIVSLIQQVEECMLVLKE